MVRLCVWYYKENIIVWYCAVLCCVVLCCVVLCCCDVCGHLISTVRRNQSNTRSLSYLILS